MAPKAKKAAAKPKAEPKAKADAKAKAKAAPGATAAGSGAAAAKQSRVDAAESPRDKKVRETEALLRECLEEKEVANVDGRVLDIAIGQAKFLEKPVDKDLLAKAEKRLEEVKEFEAELKKRAEELRAKKDEVIKQHDEQNELFSEACSARKDLKQQVEALFDAVGDSELDKVKKCILSVGSGVGDGFPLPPIPVDAEDHEGNTPMSEAACYGEIEIVEFLLESGAHPNTRNKQGRTPLWRAVYNGHDEVVKFLLDKGADPTIETNDGEPPGKFGTESTKGLIASWDNTLTAENSEENLTASQRLPKPWPRLLLEACEKGDSAAATDVVKAISAEEGNAKGLIRTIINFEEMADALWMATTRGHLELCRVLLDAGADVDSYTDTGLTCLMIACRKGHTEIVKELLKRGAKTYLRSDQGRLASDYAREYGDGHAMHDIVISHCKNIEDWSTLEEEARQSGGNKACGREAAEAIIDGRKNAGASTAITAELKAMSADELKEGGDRYKELLEQRALADVLGMG
eukprot:TRINITY_DN5364_c2_g4_i1.p1 TRINITY_DN5364_c2_g4~~TRINITY_DN5364_c2_g4_i1.p1  ORF type:complete len:531 (-),score=158.37 TRINITY_DN5364_c2_g4_i1:106-1665(-)